MAAFALGMIGDPEATAALEAALDDPAPLVQGRAAEALGRIGPPRAPTPSRRSPVVTSRRRSVSTRRM